MMTVIWADTETTGLEPINSGAFEIAFLVYQDRIVVEGKLPQQFFIEEKVFRLNPLDDEVLYHESAFDVHGITKEEIMTYPPAGQVVPEIAEYLKKFCPEEKMIFAGYNCPFDYGHISALLFRHGGYMMSNLFVEDRVIDVLERVRINKDILPRTKNQKLETMTKALGIEHEGAHGALSDIKATRRLYEAIWLIQNQNRRNK
jgi:DNA polymerase III epsilon subunit-like protein